MDTSVLWLLGAAVVLAVLIFLARGKQPAQEKPIIQPARRVVHEPVTKAPPTKSFEDIARNLVAQIAPEEARILADMVDAALDNGEESLTLTFTAEDGQPHEVTFPAAFLEVLLDELVDRYPELQELVDAPRVAARGDVREQEKRHLVPPLAKGLNRRIELLYEDARGNESSRVVTIRHVLGDDPEEPEYIVGVCELRRSLRRFRLDRVIEVTDLETGEVLEEGAAVVAWARSLFDSRSVSASLKEEVIAEPWTPLPPPDLAATHRLLKQDLQHSVLISQADEEPPGVLHIHAIIGGKSGPLRLYGRWEPWNNRPRRIRLSSIRVLSDGVSKQPVKGTVEMRAWTRRLASADGQQTTAG